VYFESGVRADLVLVHNAWLVLLDLSLLVLLEHIVPLVEVIDNLLLALLPAIFQAQEVAHVEVHVLIATSTSVLSKQFLY
jgi:hypothetical protein